MVDIGVIVVFGTEVERVGRRVVGILGVVDNTGVVKRVEIAAAVEV